MQVKSLLADDLIGFAKKTDNCWVDAGVRYQIDPYILYAIAVQESSLNPLAINYNKGSYDLGLMQINSFWFPKIKEYGITEKDLLDPCTSIYVGAWVLSQAIEIFGNNWRAVGAYNAGTGKGKKREKMRKKYAEIIHAHYIKLVNGRLRGNSSSKP